MRWLVEGEKCPRCGGSGEWVDPDDGSQTWPCEECGSTGYTRKPWPHCSAFRDLPEVLAECVRMRRPGAVRALVRVGGPVSAQKPLSGRGEAFVAFVKRAMNQLGRELTAERLSSEEYDDAMTQVIEEAAARLANREGDGT